MIKIGPQFLHRPLPRFRSSSFRDALRWLADGLALAVPTRLYQLGIRPRHMLASVNSDGSIAPIAVVQRSWLGYTRQVVTQSIPEGMPIAIVLGDSDFFETFVNLPATSERTALDAATLRLNVLSPLAPSDVQIATTEAIEAGAGRIDVPVAIARKSEIERILTSKLGDRIAMVGARPIRSGYFQYEFFRHGRGAGVLTIQMALIAVGVFVLMAGTTAYIERQFEAQSKYEDSLRAALRNENQAASFLESAAADMPQGFGRHTLASSFNNIVEHLPDKVWLEKVQITEKCIVVEGLFSKGTNWSDSVAPAVTSVDSLGIASFSFLLDECSAQ